MKKHKCIFCGDLDSDLLCCEDTCCHAHRTCLVKALSENCFVHKAELAEQMAYLLASELEE